LSRWPQFACQFSSSVMTASIGNVRNWDRNRPPDAVQEPCSKRFAPLYPRAAADKLQKCSTERPQPAALRSPGFHSRSIAFESRRRR
jgi:hypothetical protein